jgi:hypothetical protein
MSRIERCSYPGCKTHLPVELVYCDRPLCVKHWALICSLPPEESKAILNVRQNSEKVLVDDEAKAGEAAL